MHFLFKTIVQSRKKNKEKQCSLACLQLLESKKLLLLYLNILRRLLASFYWKTELKLKSDLTSVWSHCKGISWVPAQYRLTLAAKVLSQAWRYALQTISSYCWYSATSDPSLSACSLAYKLFVNHWSFNNHISAVTHGVITHFGCTLLTQVGNSLKVEIIPSIAVISSWKTSWW